MPVKQGLAKGVRGSAPQDPRDMAKAGLLAAQSPAVKVTHPSERRPKPMLASCPTVNRGAGQPPWRGAPPSEGGQGDKWAAYVTLDTYDEDERGIAYGREPYGDGVPTVVVGVTSHQGDRESRSTPTARARAASAE
jgi:hypothetical protein